MAREVLTRLQKNPFFLFHLHLIRRRPVETFPASQTAIQVALSHVTSFTPSGLSSTGQLDHSADCLTPTGCAHLKIGIKSLNDFLSPTRHYFSYDRLICTTYYLNKLIISTSIISLLKERIGVSNHC